MKQSVLGNAARVLACAALWNLLSQPSFALGPMMGGLDGSWAEADNGTNGTFTRLLTFTRNFDKNKSNPSQGEATETYVSLAFPIQPAGRGTWVQTGDNQYALTVWFVDSTGAYEISHLHESILVNSAATSYSGTFEMDILDQQGNILQKITGTATGCRIQPPQQLIGNGERGRGDLLKTYLCGGSLCRAERFVSE